MDRNDLFSHFIKLIVMSLGIFLIVINIIVWANGKDVAADLESTLFNWNYKAWHGVKMSEYKGFRWFYEKLSTFPGLNTTISTFNKMANIVNVFDTGEPGNIIEFLRSILMILTAPVVLFFTIMLDVVNLIGWFVSFLWNIGV